MPEQNIDRLACFFDQSRFCGADCMAYKTIPDKNAVLDGSQQNCVILSSIERTGRSLNIIGNILNEHLKLTRLQANDAKRGSPPPPPNPLGNR